MRKSVPVSVLALLAVCAGVIVAAVEEIGPPSSSARTETQMVTAEKGVVQTTVTGTGNVEPAVDDDVDFKASGTLKHVYVATGDHVTKGQLLATLDSSSARLSLQQAELALTMARDTLAAAEKPQMTTTTTPVSTATPSTATSTPATSTPSTGRGGATGASGATGATRAFATEQTAAASSATTGSAERTITTTKTTTTPATTLDQDRMTVENDEASVRSARQALRDTRLYAPVAGEIVSLESVSPGDAISAGTSGSATSSSGSSSSTSDSGSSAAGGLGSFSSGTSGSGASTSTSSSSSSGFAEIISTAHLTMTVPFSESDIADVKVGQPATVTMEALTGVELSGHVSAISPLATTSSSVVSYDATITVDQTDSRVRPGMSASVAVVTGQKSGITLPNDAVSGSGSLGTVELMKNGAATSTQVVVGLRGEDRTQIVSGLSSGQEVSVTTTLPSLGQSSSSSSSSTSGSGTLGGGFGSAAGAAGGAPGAGGGFGGGRFAARFGG